MVLGSAMQYEIELSFMDPPSSKLCNTFQTASDASKFILQSLCPNSVLFVACIHGNADYGNFYLHLNRENWAYVRINEHCGFVAKRRMYEDKEKDCLVTFIDEDGSPFSVEYGFTISSEQAIEALKYWLPDQQKVFTTEIVWGDE
jgi:hypothetical protein